MATDPRPPGVTKLVGTNFWRLRVGLRVVYHIENDDRLVVILRVARRSESRYRRVDR